MKPSCYNCQHHALCRLNRAVKEAQIDNIDMFDVDQPSSSPKCFLRIFEAVALCCRHYKEGEI